MSDKPVIGKVVFGPTVGVSGGGNDTTDKPCWPNLTGQVRGSPGDFVPAGDGMGTRVVSLSSLEAENKTMRGDLQTVSDVLRDFHGNTPWEQAQAAVARITELEADVTRFAWVLPIVSGDDDETGDTRSAALCLALLQGLTGRAAIDAAMAKEKT